MKIVAVLHNVRSVYNVGSMFRTADAACIQKMYLCGITPTPHDRVGRLREQFTKVSLGAEKFIAWEHVSSTAFLLRRLKKDGYAILALEQNARSIPYTRYNISRNQKIALLVGSETQGLSPTILRIADAILEIPMYGKKESLNVSVAFGIALFHYVSKKTLKHI